MAAPRRRIRSSSPLRPVARDVPFGDGSPVMAVRFAHDEQADLSRPPATHSYSGLLFCRRGRARVEQNGEWVVREGDVLLIPAGSPHRMLELQRPQYWAVMFCVPCLASDGAAALLDPFERVRDGAAPVVHVPRARQGSLGWLFRELEEVGREQTVSHVLDPVRQSLLTLILAEVVRASRADASPRTSRNSMVTEALRFIERNCLRRLTLKEIAASVRRSPAHVTTALTQATGRSAGDWIVSGRMAEARRLLLHSDELIDVISERVGYADVTHFIRMFRREHGSTPAAWRAAKGRAAASP